MHLAQDDDVVHTSRRIDPISVPQSPPRFQSRASTPFSIEVLTSIAAVGAVIIGAPEEAGSVAAAIMWPPRLWDCPARATQLACLRAADR
jgi:hypothetical protein